MSGLAVDSFMPILRLREMQRNASFEDSSNKQGTAESSVISDNSSSPGLKFHNTSSLSEGPKSKSSKNLSLPARKKPKLNRLTTEALISVSKHRIPRNLKSSIKYSNRASAEKVIGYDLDLQEAVEKGLVDTNLGKKRTSGKLDNSIEEEPPTPKVNFKFLIEKQVDKIK